MKQDVSINIFALAGQIQAGIEAGDLEKIEKIFSPNAGIYHYFDNSRRKTWPDVKIVLRSIFENTRSRKLDNIRITEITGGFFQQHDLNIVGLDGSQKVVHAILIFKIDDAGLVVSMEEYLDTAQLFG